MPRSMTAALAEKRLVMKTVAARRFVVEIYMAVVVWLTDCKGMDRSNWVLDLTRSAEVFANAWTELTMFIGRGSVLYVECE